MKTLAKIAFIGFLLFLVLTGNAKQKILFNKAIENKLIKTTAICNGGLELKVNFTNLLKDSLQITIPAGWRFASNDKKQDYQDVLLVHDETILLKSNETKAYNIKGYCCEYTLSGPTKGIPYSNGKLAEERLLKVAQFLNTNPIDNNTEQYSVWAVSDNKETANITAKNDSLASMLRNFVAGIKGEPIPWYTLLKRGHVSETGTVNDKPINFKATIQPEKTSTCYSYCYITDTKGNIVSNIKGDWLYPESTDIKANFNVAHLNKGNYTLVVVSDKKDLFKREFTI